MQEKIILNVIYIIINAKNIIIQEKCRKIIRKQHSCKLETSSRKIQLRY